MDDMVIDLMIIGLLVILTFQLFVVTMQLREIRSRASYIMDVLARKLDRAEPVASRGAIHSHPSGERQM